MSKQQGRVFTDEFKREAVGMIASSGRTLRQVAGDLGLGLSTLTRWKRQLKDVEIAITPNLDVTKDLTRLRKENEVLKQLLREAWYDSGKVYGYRKLHDDMRDQGETCCPNRVA